MKEKAAGRGPVKTDSEAPMKSISKLKRLLRSSLMSHAQGSRRRHRSSLRADAAPMDAAIESLEVRQLLAGVAGGPPDVFITKGVVASTDPTAAFDSPTGPIGVVFAEPGTHDLPFSGVVTSEGIRTGATPQSLNANLTNVTAGDVVRYAVLLENRSAVGGAFDVTLRDALPAGVTYVPNSLQVVDGTGQRLTFRDLAGSIDGSGLFTSGIQLNDPGATQGAFFEADHCAAIDGLAVDSPGRNVAIAFYDVTVQNTAGNTALQSSVATLVNYSQTEGGANLSTSPVDAATMTLERIDLEVTKLVSNPSPFLGDSVTWTIDVTNNAANATSAATGVVVRDVVPAGQSIVAGSAVFPAGGTFNEATGVWTVGQSIAPGATARMTFRSLAANSVEFATSLVDVELTGQVPRTPVSVGSAVDYSITVTNNSEAATTSATGVVVSDLLPAGLSFVSHAVSAGTFNSTSGVWDLSAVALAAGQSETITISTTASAGAAGTVIPFAAAVTALTQTDVDSTAGNAAAAEDDDFTAGVTIRAAAATRSVSGVAFLDVNNDGVNAAETGVAGITVNAYAPDGSLSGTAITDAGGSYTIANVTTEAVRLEFIGFDRQQSVTTAQSPPASATTFSSLAFLDAGTSNLTADLAMYRPTTQALYVTTCFVYSGQSTLDPTLEPAVYTFNADGSVRGILATISQVGATNGLAFHAASGDRFVGAFQKRHSDIGPDGNSAIYRISSTGVVSTFIKLDDFFGADSAGVYSHDPANWFTDAPAFDAVGKTALGDVEVSADGRFLYTINLATRELIQIPIGTGTSTTPVDYAAGDTRSVLAIPILGDALVAPTNGGIALQDLGVDPTTNVRPFALAVRDGLVYVGMVNSAETTTNPADLAAFVYIFDPATGQFRTTPASAFPLGTRVNGGGWQEWVPDFTSLPTFYDAAGDFYVVGNAQPLLTDIEFDNNGDMILGFRDRIGDQIGHMTGDLTGADNDASGAPDRFYHDTRGEVLRLRQSTLDTWTVEPGHTAGDTTEYYVGDEAQFDPASAALHPEVGQGGLVQIPGFNDIVTTAIDPQSFFAGGVVALDNATGVQVDALDVYTGSDLSDLVTFGKNNGLGDLEYANNLTMEVGNRIWNDIDKDGIQDAGEAAFANVDLVLFDVSDPAAPLQVGTTTTNTVGEYYFNDSNVAYSDGGDPVGLRALTNYEIRVVAAEFQAGGTLNQFRVTARDQSPTLVPLTTQTVTGAAAFDSNLDSTLDTARNQRIDVLTPTGLAADGVRVVVTNATGGLARVESDGTVVFEFIDGSVAGAFDYVIVDDRIDSDAVGFDDDADGVTDRAVLAFTSGATGSTDHSLDLGFFETKVDLELSKLSTRKFAIEGDAVTFVVTLSNNALTADAPATGVTVTDVIPAGLTFVAGSVIASQGTFNGTLWTLPNSILPGEVATLSYRAAVGAGTAGTVLVNSAQVASQDQADVDSLINNDDGDQSEDDEDNAVVLVGTATNSTVINTAQVSAANEPDFDSTPNNDDHNQSEDDENAAQFTLSTAIALDFGDLPDVYQTLLASGGPSHRRGSATFLGTAIDSESDGQPSATAVAEGADDDGVRFLNPLLPGSAATIEVTGSTAGILNAWIDFDANGTLDEVSITAVDGVVLGAPVAANDLALTAGVHTLTIAVPASATGLMAARFRYTSDQMAAARSPGGEFLNGEVEDYVLRQIGDRVWFDHNANGIVDSLTETGISGITVVLSADLDGNGVAESYSTTTDANGFYRFDGIPQGSYTVTVTPPASFSATFDLDGGNDNTASVTFADATASRLDVDFGYRGSGLIGDTVWLDTNADGTQDAGESGISGVAVQLTGDLNGDAVTDVTLNTTTSAAGLYEFLNLIPGTYTVTVTPPTGTTQTFDANGLATPNASTVVLAAGAINRDQDFGFRTPVVAGTGLIGDVIWDDLDGDGVIDTGEPGRAGVAVRLTGDLNGDTIIDVTLNTVTNGAGVYEFPNLDPGTYTVTVTPPTGTEQTFDSDGIATANVSTIALAAGAVNRLQDFGYRTPVANALIGDRVWIDTDLDGLQDANEPGVSGVAVRLTGDTNGDSVIDVTLDTTTNATGLYEFTGLSAGVYTITVTPPTGSTPTFDANGIATPNVSTVTLAAGETVRTQDFGYSPAAPTTVDLAVTKDNNNPQDLAAVGAVVTYTVIVSNSGPAAATNAVVTDTLPSTFTNATWTASGTAGTVFASSGSGNLAETVSIPAGGMITYQVAAQLNGSFTGTVTNTATVTTTQSDIDLTNNSATDTTSVSPLTLTVESPLVPGQPFQIGARGMSHVALVPFIVGTRPGAGTINGVAVGIADPQVFMVGFVCVDDRIIGVYDVPANLAGQTLYFQSYESSPTPRLSNLVSGVVGAPRVVVTQTGGSAAVAEGSTTDTFSVRLSQAPVSDVVVDVQSQSPSRLAVSATAVTFTPSNWNVPQTITLQAVEDSVFNGDGTANVQLSVRTGSDAAFVGGFQQVFGVTVSDNDVLTSPVLSDAFVSTQSQQPTISWSAVPGAASYDVWISSTVDVQNPIVNTNVTGTSFTPTSGLGIGKLAVWVRARTAGGRISPYSAAGRIDITAAPAIASIPDGINRRPAIAWSTVAGAARYELWVTNTTTGESRVIHETALIGTSFTPTADLGMGIYAVWVRAINQSGQASDWSAVERFNVGVELLSPTTTTFDAQPEFTWSALPDAATYEIYLRVGSTVVRQDGLTTPTFTPSAALPTGTHRWWVRGVAANGKAGGWSSPAEVSIGGRPTIVAPTATAATSTTPQFAWGAVDGAASYIVYVSLVSTAGGSTGAAGLEFQTSGITASSYTHGIPLSNSNATYRVWVRAISGSGVQSPWSLPVTFTVAIAEPPTDDDAERLLTLFEATLPVPVAAPVRAADPEYFREQESQSTDDDNDDIDIAMAEAAVIGW